MTDDRTLLIRTHKGHEASARELWNRHAPAMLTQAGVVLRDRSAADDVVQAAFCRVLELDRKQLKHVQDVRAWLCQVTRRLAINELRSTRRERDRRRRAAQSTVREATRDDDVGHAVAALPRRLREVVMLKHAGGLTFDQIALALDLPRSTASSRYERAITELRRVLVGELEVTHG